VRYLALLRGINVGGKNLIRMPDLCRAFESAGCAAVTTYIQSGNVLFQRRLENTAKLTLAIEAALGAEFACAPRIVVLTRRQLRRVVEAAPRGFGDDPDQYRYDVIFLKPPARARSLLPTIALAEGVDEAVAQNEVLYLRRLTARASQSRFSRLIRHPAYGSMTVRNWNTTRELWRRIQEA
jgi:uncharacterized protein (DUF1697 family)